MHLLVGGTPRTVVQAPSIFIESVQRAATGEDDPPVILCPSRLAKKIMHY